MIKNIICLGCENKFDTVIFLDHVSDCRRSNNVPPINLNTVFKGKSKARHKVKPTSYFASIGLNKLPKSHTKLDLH